jgi:hypothetical protein
VEDAEKTSCFRNERLTWKVVGISNMKTFWDKADEYIEIGNNIKGG